MRLTHYLLLGVSYADYYLQGGFKEKRCNDQMCALVDLVSKLDFVDFLNKDTKSYDVENYIFHIHALGATGLGDNDDIVEMTIESNSVSLGDPIGFECSYERFGDDQWRSEDTIPMTTGLLARHSFELIQTSTITKNETNLAIEFTCQLELKFFGF